MKNIITFFFCLWITLICFGFTPNFGSSFNFFNSFFSKFNSASIARAILIDRASNHFESECRDGLGPNGYEFCIKNNGNSF